MAAPKVPVALVAAHSNLETRTPLWIMRQGEKQHLVVKTGVVWKCSCRGGTYCCDAMVAVFRLINPLAEQDRQTELAAQDDADRERAAALPVRKDNRGPFLYL